MLKPLLISEYLFCSIMVEVYFYHSEVFNQKDLSYLLSSLIYLWKPAKQWPWSQPLFNSTLGFVMWMKYPLFDLMAKIQLISS